MSGQVPGADDLGLQLVPPLDDVVSPADDLNAAAASALDDAQDAVEAVSDAPEPFGVSWAFDYEAGRFRRQGTSPGRVTGLDALVEWCMVALSSTRFAHAIFSDGFGVERRLRYLGKAGPTADEVASDWSAKARDALMVHDRIVDVKLNATYDPVTGAILVSEDDFIVTTDEDVDLTFPDLQITES